MDHNNPVQEHDRRTTVRQRALKAATAVVHDGDSVFDCIIRNMSETGVKLELESPHVLPTTFELQDKSRYINRLVQVMWRDRSSAGVQFIQ